MNRAPRQPLIEPAIAAVTPRCGDCDPTDAAPPFNLGNIFRATGRKIEAEAALRVATRADPTFAEAWYNLSDLLDEQGRSEAAIGCLRRVLHAAPDYADAMFNLALLLQRGSRHKAAAECCRQYLAKGRRVRAQRVTCRR